MQTTQTAIRIKPKGMDYQRNGISGIGFYTIIFDWENRNEDESGKGFIATFETDEDDNQVKIETCRVIDPKNPLQGWRGDNFAYGINHALHELRVFEAKQMIYDLMGVINTK